MRSKPRAKPARSLSHVVGDGPSARARMVDVGKKRATSRSALARARVEFPPGLLDDVLGGRGPKGPVLEVARAAGVLAAKRTGELVPLCHSLGLDHVDVEFARDGADALEVRCRASCESKTGVEMEALVGASLAALTIYDMTKALDPAIAIARVELVEKEGGKRGRWVRT